MDTVSLFTLLLERAGFYVIREWMMMHGPKYRWDLAVYDKEDNAIGHDQMPFVLVEVHGATWTKGGHSTGQGIQRDCKKLRRAVSQGYRQFSFTKDEIDKNPDACVREIEELSWGDR